jgi:NADH-quinone oxidoreductase subunit E
MTAAAAVTPEMRARFDREVAKYPLERKQSAVAACLAIVQEEHGHVSKDAETAVAEHLGMPPVAVHEVATFYSMYNVRPVGRYKLSICTSLPCQLRGAAEALHRLERRLGIPVSETTQDGLFTLQRTQCLGACADAPVMLVNDRSMCSFMTSERLDRLVDGLAALEHRA